MGKMRLSNNLTVKTSIKTRLVVVAATGISIALFCGIGIYIYFNLFDARDSIAQPGSGYYVYTFGESNSQFKSGSSTTFLPKAPSGVATSVVKSGGYLELVNEGSSAIGSASYLKIVPTASNNGFAKISISDFVEGSAFYTSFMARFTGNSGEWIFAQGNGSSFTNSSELSGQDVFSAIKFLNIQGKITLFYLKNNKWEQLYNVELQSGKTYQIKIFGNNQNTTSIYQASSGEDCINNYVGNGKWDLWIDNKKVGASLINSRISNKKAINSLMIYGQNTSSNNDFMSIDDIIYANHIPIISESLYQPENLLFSEVKETSVKLAYTPADGQVDGYLVLRKEDLESVAYPQNFINYKKGDVVGDALVAYIGPASSIVDAGLMSETTYFYSIFSYTGSDNCRVYTRISPLKGNITTPYNRSTSLFRSVKDGAWDLPETWEYEYAAGMFTQPETAPGIENRILIRNGHTVHCNSINISHLKIDKGGNLKVNGSLYIKSGSLSSGLQNNGTLYIGDQITSPNLISNRDNATVVFNGSGGQIIPPTSYQNLVIAGSEKVLSGNITINQSINIEKGVLKTGIYKIILASESRIINENNENYIAGNIEATAYIDGDSKSFGNLGVTIDATGTYQTLGQVKVVRTTSQEKVISLQESIKKSWHIIPEIQPEEEVVLSMNWYKHDEIQGFVATSCQPWKSVDGGVTWEQVGSPQNATSRSITIPVSSFSTWTIGNGLSAMPVRFIEFKSEESAAGLKLQWSTAIEINNMGFEVERSYDAKNYEKIGFVDGNGTTNKVMSYEYAIQGQDKMTYYRLKQIDYDGKFDYSKIISVKATEQMKMFKAYPNPFSNNLNISINGTIPNGKKIKVDMYDINGNIIFSHVEEVFLMNEILSQEAQNIPGGRYILHITYENKTERINLLKK